MGLVFPRITENGYWRRLKRYCAAHDLPLVSPYEMLHTFVSVIQSMPEGDIKALVGHSRSMDTLDVYAHAVNGQGDRIALNVQTIFADILGQLNDKKTSVL